MLWCYMLYNCGVICFIELWCRMPVLRCCMLYSVVGLYGFWCGLVWVLVFWCCIGSSVVMLYGF